MTTKSLKDINVIVIIHLYSKGKFKSHNMAFKVIFIKSLIF